MRYDKQDEPINLTLRLPAGLHAALKKNAERGDRSLQREINRRLRESLASELSPEPLLGVVTALEEDAPSESSK